MSQPTSPQCRRRRGATLLEVVVVLALMGLVLSIAAPAFILPNASSQPDVAAVVATARRAAILRAEPVTLAVDQAGSWRVDSDATPGAPPVATGQLGPSASTVRLRISPLGTCVPESTDGASATQYTAACGDFPRDARSTAR